LICDNAVDCFFTPQICGRFARCGEELYIGVQTVNFEEPGACQSPGKVNIVSNKKRSHQPSIRIRACNSRRVFEGAVDCQK
jgi:hypothetical protein